MRLDRSPWSCASMAELLLLLLLLLLLPVSAAVLCAVPPA
jgi:hypothetical protein